MTDGPSHCPGLYVLGHALRERRIDRGMTLRQLARELAISPASLSAWENGERRIEAGPLGWLLGYLQAPPVDYHFLMRLHGQSERASYIENLKSGTASLQLAYERYALRTFEWAPHVVPDLLQTSEYAHAVLGRHVVQPDDVDQEILTRQVRHLDRDPQHRHTLLLGAAALTSESVPQEVLHAQLQQITTPASRPQVDARVVPADACSAGAIDPFVIYETAAKIFTVVLQHEHTTVYLSDPVTVKRYRSTFGALQGKTVDYLPVGSC